MKKGALNILGRKNHSLFDTNIKMKDMDNMELVLESSATSESGTASVRARPTVKHHASPSFDTFQGFAVPTPRVPILPPVNGPKINGSVGGDSLSSGSVISVPDFEEGEIFIPPPPSMAPPPPPFIPPPPDFMGDLNSLDMQKLQPPPMSASLAQSMVWEDLTSLKPPPMAPPKPPSTCSRGSASLPISSPPPGKVPERPNFAPPQPSSEMQEKIYKTPPQKPIRLSSIPTLDSPPRSPAPPPPMQKPAPSTFNPQNTAKLYSIPQTSILRGYEDSSARPKQMLLLEDSGSDKSAHVLVQSGGKAPKVAPPSKPVSKDLKENLQITQTSPSPLPEPSKDAKAGTVSAPVEKDNPLQTLQQTSPQRQDVNSTLLNPESSKYKYEGPPSPRCKFSPLLDRKLRNLKSSGTNSARDGPVASPLALLMAAKEREKHRLSQTLSHENIAKKNEQPSASIYPSDRSPNSFIVTPRSNSSSLLTSRDLIKESPKSASPVEHIQIIETPQRPSSSALVKDKMPFTSLTPNTQVVTQKQNKEQSLSNSQSTEHEDDMEELSMPLLPPPPEFDDLDEKMEPPSSIPPPDSLMTKAPTQTESLPPAQVPPPPPTKPKPPAAPKLPPPDTNIKPKPQVHTKPKANPPQLPSTLSPSQATLLSILQKKMLEMDHKMAPVKESESSSDDWGTPLSDEDNKVHVVSRATPQSKNYPVANKAATLNMQELEDKFVKKYQETPSVKAPDSNGLPSKHKYGMTFTVRPGTKQPITLVGKGES